MARQQREPRSLGGRVRFAVPLQVAYDYLADPRNRPEWQSSLKSVEMLDEGEPRVGMSWLDQTSAGIVPRMEITVMEPGKVWAEVGVWRAFSALLVLGFEPSAAGCVVDVRFRVSARGLLAPVGWLATGAAVPAVLIDVKKAARILAARHAS